MKKTGYEGRPMKKTGYVKIGIYNTVSGITEFEKTAFFSDEAVKLHAEAHEAYIVQRPDGFSEKDALETWVFSIENHRYTLALDADWREVHDNFDTAWGVVE